MEIHDVREQKVMDRLNWEPDNVEGVIEPLEDRVLIEPDPLPTTTASGLVVVGRAIERECVQIRTGTIRAVGPGRVSDHGTLIPVLVGVGDRVIYGKYLGMPLRHRGVEVVMAKATELLGVVR